MNGKLPFATAPFLTEQAEPVHLLHIKHRHMCIEIFNPDMTVFL